MGFQWKLSEQFSYSYIHGSLKSNIQDDGNPFYIFSGKSNPPDIQRNLAGHRLSWSPHEAWELAFNELVIYGNRSIEWGYSIPLLPFFPVQGYLSDSDNILMSADILYRLHRNAHIYGSFLMDEWSPPYTFIKDNQNWFGWQFGVQLENVTGKENSLQAEYTWTDHRIYKHKFQINDSYSWGYPIGFWAGPHAEELYIKSESNFPQFTITLVFSNTKRGEITPMMLADQYGRPNENPKFIRYQKNNEICSDCMGIVETRKQFIITMERKIFSKLQTQVSYSYLQWQNAGFNPRKPVEDAMLPEITKHSLGAGFVYCLD